jgi:hypothetical protein
MAPPRTLSPAIPISSCSIPFVGFRSFHPIPFCER